MQERNELKTDWFIMRRQDTIEIKQEAASWVSYKLFSVTRVREKRVSVNTQSRNSCFSPKTKWDDASSDSFLRIQVKGYLQAPSYSSSSSLPEKQNKKWEEKKKKFFGALPNEAERTAAGTTPAVSVAIH